MRDPTVFLYVSTCLSMCASAWLIRRLRDARVALTASAVQVLVWSTAVLAFPWYSAGQPDKRSSWIFVVLTLTLLFAVVALALMRPRIAEGMARFTVARPRLQNGLLAVMSVLVSFGTLEFIAGTLTRAGVLKRYTPTETVVANETEDWRLHHIMSDDFREPDPVLLWKPVARPPYTAQRFRGPVITTATPARTVRIFCYGDSNTDGPPEGGAWPEALGRAVTSAGTATGFEVINAGVTGYSSYQGRRRMEQDLPIYRPDIVVVSFGWNDATAAISTPDKAFAGSAALQAVDPGWLTIRRTLLGYDTLSVLARALAPPRSLAQAVSAQVGPRVALDDYRENLRAMIALTHASGGQIVLMTRPHRDSRAVLERADGWRHRVPAYNDVVRDVSEAEAVPLVDAQREFDGKARAFLDESHLTRDGHDTLARVVADRLDATSAYRERR